MKALRFYSRYWAAVGGLVFVGLAFWLGIKGDAIPTLQRLAVLLYMSLLFHQFEEYIFPGGFPAACNVALFGEKENVHLYPLNQLSALTVNVFCAYPLYLVGIVFYEHLWIIIFLSYFTMLQVLMHCIKMNISLRSWYCPGCLSALLVMLPIGVYTLHFLASNYTFPHYYWWAPALVFPVIAGLTIMLPIKVFQNRETRFGFAKHEADDFAVMHGIASLFRKDK